MYNSIEWIRLHHTVFNEHFANVGPNLAAQLLTVAAVPIVNAGSCTLYLTAVDENEVANIIKNLTESVAWRDGMKASVVKAVTPITVRPLDYVVNISFKQ